MIILPAVSGSDPQCSGQTSTPHAQYPSLFICYSKVHYLIHFIIYLLTLKLENVHASAAVLLVRIINHTSFAYAPLDLNFLAMCTATVSRYIQ